MMSRYVYRVGHRWVIEGPIDTVWHYVSDARTYPQWDPSVLVGEVRRDSNGSDSIQVGAVVHARGRCILPYDVIFDGVVTRVEPPYYLEMDTHVSGGGRTRWHGVTRIQLKPRGPRVEIVEMMEFPVEQTEPPVPALFRPLVSALANFNHAACARKGGRGLQQIVDAAVRGDTAAVPT
jgi:uncharacterized protein YndB with AHSA1/START domain